MDSMTPNQIVAHNVRQLRHERHWSQSQLASHLTAALGETWTLHMVSNAEQAAPTAKKKSMRAQRERAFNLDELAGLARVLHVSAVALMLPPPDVKVRLGSLTLDREDFALLVFQLPPSTIDNLESTARTESMTTVLRQWSEVFEQLTRAHGVDELQQHPSRQDASIEDLIPTDEEPSRDLLTDLAIKLFEEVTQAVWLTEKDRRTLAVDIKEHAQQLARALDARASSDETDEEKDIGIH